MWFLYELLLVIGVLLYLPKAVWRRRLPHRGWGMRLGRYPEDVRARLGGGGTIWIHAVSVGEVIAVQPLIRKLMAEQPESPLVLSTVTPTGFHVASKWLDRQGVVLYGPLDFRATVKRAMHAIRPRILLLVESELWPNLIRLAAQRRVPVVVVNGRISERAFRRYRRVASWLAPILNSIELFLMQTQEDAARVLEIGAPQERVKVVGNLKWDASVAARPGQSECESLAARLGVGAQETLLVAGSTHSGEETALLEAFESVRTSRPTRLIIAPRHLERVGDIEEFVRQRGMRVQRITRLLEGLQPWDVAILDTMGQLPSYYGLASVVFVGGSLIPHGGQNPLEPASLGKPVIVGPSMHNFSEITRQLLAHQAIRQLQGPAELTPALQALLADSAQARLMGRRAQELIERSIGCAQRTLEAIEPLLTRPSST